MTKLSQVLSAHFGKKIEFTCEDAGLLYFTSDDHSLNLLVSYNPIKASIARAVSTNKLKTHNYYQLDAGKAADAPIVINADSGIHWAYIL